MLRPALFVRCVLWLWFATAVAGGYYLVLQRLAPSAMPMVIIGLTALVLYTYFRLPGLREWVDALDPRALVQIHLTRLVGVYFLFLFNRGELPYAFAVPAGVGDIIVALLAVALIAVPLDRTRLRRFLTIWNVIGFVDIILVVVTAARITLAAPYQLRALTHLPLSLLPTFLVPLIIATHIMIFARLLRR
ncbi:MAG: hypothetical protein H7343_00690 [Undibacterium sp.]|nr:hypothetical protein [Opitutaceae bacterium]